jgi:hypothetical protein
MVVRRFGFVSVPLRIPRLIPMEPLKEPKFRSPHVTVNSNGRFVLKELLDSHLSQAFFFHLITSWVGLLWDIIKQFQPQGNRCIGTKTATKGYRCSGTFGLSMYWHLPVTSYEGAKGLSAQYVFIIGVHEGELPRDSKNVQDLEICKFIVGLTRTRKKCTFLCTTLAGNRERRLSLFLRWIRRERYELTKVNATYWKKERKSG